MFKNELDERITRVKNVSYSVSKKIKMDRRAEYELFLADFQLRFGYLPPPTYKEWSFYKSRVVIRNTHQHPHTEINLVHGDVPAHALVPVNLTVTVPESSGTNSSSNLSSSHASRAIWSNVEEKVLVNTWKENFELFKTVNKNEAWDKVLSAVASVGNKTLKQCKDKIRNLREQYKVAVDKNKQSGGNLYKSSYFDDFDEVLGTRHGVTTPFGITMPFVKEVEVEIQNEATATPTRENVEIPLKSGKKRKDSTKIDEMRTFFQETVEKHERFLSQLLVKQMEEQKAEREKDRKFFMALFKMDKNK